MHINLNTRGRSGDLVLRTHSLQVGYHDEGRPLFDCPDLVLMRQECAAIIGPNGAGKNHLPQDHFGADPSPIPGRLN